MATWVHVCLFLRPAGVLFHVTKFCEQATNRLCTLLCLASVSEFHSWGPNSRREFGHFWGYLASVLHSTQRQCLVVTTNLLSWILTLRFNLFFSLFCFATYLLALTFLFSYLNVCLIRAGGLIHQNLLFVIVQLQNAISRRVYGLY